MTDQEKDKERLEMLAALPDVIKRHLPADFVMPTRDEHRAWRNEEARKFSLQINQRIQAVLERNMSIKKGTEPLGLCQKINPATAATAAAFRCDKEDQMVFEDEL
ncbi:hypothetical protein HAP94_07960 [Acidithiobacillus ferrivorans]|nr:hypothetical protein [Acidithiobacillus ferrivorans]